MPKRPVVVVRRPLFTSPGATYSGIKQIVELKKKPSLSRTTNFHIVRVAGSRSSRAEIVAAERGKGLAGRCVGSELPMGIVSVWRHGVPLSFGTVLLHSSLA